MEPGSENTFFCSELVASAYRKLGLLPKEKSSARYWPRDFSEDSGITLCRGVLKAERVLNFNIED